MADIIKYIASFSEPLLWVVREVSGRPTDRQTPTVCSDGFAAETH